MGKASAKSSKIDLFSDKIKGKMPTHALAGHRFFIRAPTLTKAPHTEFMAKLDDSVASSVVGYALVASVTKDPSGTLVYKGESADLHQTDGSNRNKKQYTSSDL